MSMRMPLKMFMVLAAAIAIVVGLMLPVAHRSSAATSQVELLELGRG